MWPLRPTIVRMDVSVEDLERRVTALEARVRATETDRVTVGQKLDAVLGTEEVVLGLLRDQARLLSGHDARFDRIDTRLEGIDTRLEAIDTRLEGIDSRFVGIDSRFVAVEGRLDLVVDWIQRQP